MIEYRTNLHAQKCKIKNIVNNRKVREIKIWSVRRRRAEMWLLSYFAADNSFIEGLSKINELLDRLVADLVGSHYL